MELNICHLYPDLLNSYGDIGNILVMKHRLEERNINVNIFNVSINDNFDEELYDIVFFGGGQDFEQSIVSTDLKETKRDSIKKYIEANKVFIAICGGYQLLGKYYMSANNERLEGLNILNIQTEKGDVRAIDNLIIDNNGVTYVGFENHSGKTYINDLQPLGKIIYGLGNNGEDGYEGCRYKNTIGTYMHGPLFTKNPELCDEILLAALTNKYGEVTLNPLDDTFELKAKQVLINRYKKTNNNQ